jgi:tight adherence protein C
MPQNVYLVCIFAAVFLLGLTITRIFFSLEKRKDRLDLQRRSSALWQLIREFYARFAYINAFLPFPRYRNYVERMIRESDREGQTSFEEFVAMQELLGIGLPLFTYFCAWDSLLVALLAGAAGFYAPIIRLDADRKRRQRKILADLPYMMDLLTLSVEAGADFIFSIQNIIDNFPERPLKKELRTLLHNIRSGNSRRDAMTKMKDRLQLFEVTSLVSALIRADEMGTGLVNVLRLQSVSIKNKRAQQRREAAKRASTMMTIPLVLFIFPCMFILVLGPVAIKVYQMMTGQA